MSGNDDTNPTRGRHKQFRSRTKRSSNPEARMGVAAHLAELRKRLIYALVGLAVGTVAGWFLYEPVLAFLIAPLRNIDDAYTNLNFQSVGAALDLKLTMSIWISFIVTSPWWITQLGLFIAPALKRKEKIYTVLFGISGVVLFALGSATALMMAPKAIEILQSFTPEGTASLVQANSYISFYMRLVVAFGTSFLAPEILVALNFLGLISARRMLREWRWATIIAFVFAAIANPLPSPWPMIFQSLALLALYLIAVLISWLNDRRRTKALTN